MSMSRIRNTNETNTGGLIVISYMGKHNILVFFFFLVCSIITNVFFSFLFHLTRYHLYLAKIQYCSSGMKRTVNTGVHRMCIVYTTANHLVKSE